MEAYEIKEIYGDGYERWAEIKLEGAKESLYVHFIEYDEYLENTDIPIKKKKGDILKCTIKIGLVTEYKVLSSGASGFIQSIDKSSNVTAIGIVTEVEDTDSLLCSIKGLGENIAIEFEDDIVINVGATIEMNGSLELEIE